MIWLFPKLEAVVLRCDTPSCGGNLPFPMSWNPNPASIRAFASACGWANSGNMDYCLECTEAHGVREPVTSDSS